MCEILGFKNINDTLLKGVKQSHKTDLKLLVELTCVDHANSTSYHESKTVYISEPGLYQLELATVLPIGCSPLGSYSHQDWKLLMNFVPGFLKRFCQPFAEPANSKLL